MFKKILENPRLYMLFQMAVGGVRRRKLCIAQYFKHSERCKNPRHSLWARLCCDLRASFDLGGIGCGMEIY